VERRSGMHHSRTKSFRWRKHGAACEVSASAPITA
jgi:hypothetical protein